MGSAEPFQHTDLPSLTDVLQAAHANGSHRAAALAAKSLIARKWLDGHGAVWPLLLHYLEERDRDQICVDLVRGNVLPTPQPQDFTAEAFCHLLVHTPTDVYRTTAKPLDVTLDGVDLTSATLPLETVWKNMPSDREPLIQVSMELTARSRLHGIEMAVQSRPAAAAKAVIAGVTVRAEGANLAVVFNSSWSYFTGQRTISFTQGPKEMPVTFTGTFKLVEHQRQ